MSVTSRIAFVTTNFPIRTNRAGVGTARRAPAAANSQIMSRSSQVAFLSRIPGQATYMRAPATDKTTFVAAAGTFLTLILSHFIVPSAPRVPDIFIICVYRTLPAEDS